MHPDHDDAYDDDTFDDEPAPTKVVKATIRHATPICTVCGHQLALFDTEERIYDDPRTDMPDTRIGLVMGDPAGLDHRVAVVGKLDGEWVARPMSPDAVDALTRFGCEDMYIDMLGKLIAGHSCGSARREA